MPRHRHPRAQTREQWLQVTENGRREARFKFADQRIDKILAGDPPLTAEQRGYLAQKLLGAERAGAA